MRQRDRANVFERMGDPADGMFSASCRDRQCAPHHGPRARLIYESFFDFGWRPVCSPHCHPLWTQLGEGCQRCIPPSLRSFSPPSITPLPQSLPVSSIPCSVCQLFYARSSYKSSFLLFLSLLTETSDQFLSASFSLTPACLSPLVLIS